MRQAGLQFLNLGVDFIRHRDGVAARLAIDAEEDGGLGICRHDCVIGRGGGGNGAHVANLHGNAVCVAHDDFADLLRRLHLRRNQSEE